MVVDDSAPLRDDHLIAALPGGKRRGAVRYFDIVAILPQEIGVGDTVIHHSKALGTVRTVDDGYLAVVHTLADGGSVRYWWPAANCTLVRKAATPLRTPIARREFVGTNGRKVLVEAVINCTDPENGDFVIIRATDDDGEYNSFIVAHHDVVEILPEDCTSAEKAKP